MSRRPKLHIRTATKGLSKTSDIGRFDEDVNDLFDAIFASRLNGLVRFQPWAVRKEMVQELTSMYVEGIKMQIKTILGPNGLHSNPMRPSTFSLTRDLDVDEDQRFLKKNVLGFKNMTALHVGGQITWHKLSPQTIKLKALMNRRGGKANLARARAFFIDSGALKKRLRTAVTTYVRKTGVVQVNIKARNNGRFVKITKDTKSFRMADMQIKLLPKVGAGMLPGLKSGDWTHDSGTVDFERMLGFDSETLTKLGNIGPNKFSYRKRPLMQPLFTYYTLFRAPAVIAKTLPKLISQVV